MHKIKLTMAIILLFTGLLFAPTNRLLLEPGEKPVPIFVLPITKSTNSSFIILYTIPSKQPDKSKVRLGIGWRF